jgi:DNA adenine methylase
MLTKKQKPIFNFIETYIKDNDYSPTLEEVAEHFDLAVSTVHEHIEGLKENGYLEKVLNQPRSIILAQNKKNEFVTVPLVGKIAAGQPIEAIEIPGETITIPKNDLGKVGNFYALKVEGSSMIDDGIFDGDIVVLREQKNADDGQTVVAIIDDNQATLKKIFKEKNRFKLQPANQNLLPFYRKEVEIRGIVVKVIRNLEANEQNTLANRKKVFLEKIRSKSLTSSNEYKRVVVSPIRYAGGKSLGVGFITKLLPDNIKRIISPFSGGGSIEIACNKYLGLEVVGYDIFDILVNYWNIQINKPKELFKKLSELEPDAKTYKEIKERLKKHWKGEKKMAPMDLAIHYYFNHNLSYGPGFLGWPSSIYLNKERYKTTIEKVRDFKVSNFEVKCASFEEAFEKYPNDFFYCDPPYLLGHDSKMFRGIYPMRNIPVHHNGFPHEKLLDLLKKHKGGFVLSYNNCQTIRDWDKDYEQMFPEWQYTMGQGETRIGKNRIENGDNHIKHSHEIIIYSPPQII